MKTNRDLIYRILLSVICIGMIVVSCVFLQSLGRIFRTVVIFIFTVSFLIFSLLEDKYKAVFRITTVVVVFSIVIVVGYMLAEKFGWLEYLKDFDAIRSFILSTGQWGVITFLILTVMQVVFLPIPAAVTILIGVAIYGPLVSFLLSLLGTYIGSVICFWLGKGFGKKLVAWMIGKENYEKYARMLNEKGKWVFVLMLLFPFFPDDTLCLVAGATTMSWKFFLLSMLFARPAVIAFTSFFGSGSIIPYSGWGIPVWIGIFILSLVLIVAATKIKSKLANSDGKK